MKKMKNIVISWLLPVMILLLWNYASKSELFPKAILPPISKVWKAFGNLFSSGQLQEDVLISLVRVLKGYSIAVVLGIFMGTVMGTSETLNQFFSLTLNAIRQIPMLAWIPLIILWFGIGEESKVVVIVLGAYFPILLNTMNGIRNVPKGLIEVSRLYQLGPFEAFRKVYFPSALPSIFVGLKLGLGISWVAVVAAELLAASSGIGFRISDARSLIMADVVIVCMITIGAIGIAMDKGLTWIFQKITPWSKK
ncbi:MAG: ABC transporter permease [Vallitaleaceae bacterium]|nr:ABC transporter permease [Vallitaleaceae bacterium]